MINSRFFMTSSLEHRTREVSTVHTPPLGGLPVNRPRTDSRPGVELRDSIPPRTIREVRRSPAHTSCGHSDPSCGYFDGGASRNDCVTWSQPVVSSAASGPSRRCWQLTKYSVFFLKTIKSRLSRVAPVVVVTETSNR